MNKLDALLQRRPGLKKIRNSISLQIIERTIRIFMGVIVQVVMARHLGPESYGLFSYAVNLVGIFAAIPIFGLDEFIVSEMLKFTGEERSKKISTLVILRLGLGILALILLGIYCFTMEAENSSIALMIFLYGFWFLLYPSFVFEIFYVKDLKFRYTIGVRIVGGLINSTTKIIFAILNFSIPFFLLANFLEYIFMSVGFARKALKENVVSKWTFDTDYALSVLKSGWPLFVALLLTLIDQRIPQLYLESLSTPSELGSYSLSNTIIEITKFIPVAVATSLFPTIVSTFHRSQESAERRMQLFYDAMIWLSFSLIAGIYLIGPYVIEPLFGARFPDLFELLSLSCLTTLFLFFNIARVRWFTLLGRMDLWLLVNITSICISIPLQLWLIPKKHSIGAIEGYLAAQILTNIILSFISPVIRRSNGMMLKTLAMPIRAFRIMKRQGII